MLGVEDDNGRLWTVKELCSFTGMGGSQCTEHAMRVRILRRDACVDDKGRTRARKPFDWLLRPAGKPRGKSGGGDGAKSFRSSADPQDWEWISRIQKGE